MPRRPSKKNRKDSKSGPRPALRRDGTQKRWNKASDIPLDEEDHFHASRDEILLEGDEEVGFEDDDEVFALKELAEGDDDGMSEDFTEEVEEGQEEEDKQAKKTKAKKGKGKDKKMKGKVQSSDEEEEQEETWGSGRGAYYSSNAAQLDSDDDEANDMEEQEARRLQVKQLESLNEEDFGLLDIPQDKDAGIEVIAVTTTTQPARALPTDKKSLIRHLEKTSPETLALARDWNDTSENLMRVREKLAKLKDPDSLSLGMVHLHYQAILSYSTTLAFYLHMRSSEKYAQRPDMLKSHPILQRLFTLKQSLNTLEDLDFTISDDDDDDDDDDYFDEDGLQLNGMFDGDTPGLEPSELLDLIRDASTNNEVDVEDKKPPKKKRKTSKESSVSVTPVFDLEEPEYVPSKKSSSSTSQSLIQFTDSYGEAMSLQHVDAADKSARKKSLRFHTSQIESSSARRRGARNQAIGGDDDLPYRERKKEKQARAAKEAKNRVKNQGGEDLDVLAPSESIPEKRRREESDSDNVSDNPEGYYELVKRKSKERKEKKKEEYDKAHANSSHADTEVDGISGPRALTRAILANKGLTPRRPKSVRNPRVKKRQSFEKAKRKVSSQKSVYKGGISATGGRYDGEKTGISKVVKSVRLG